MVAGSLMNAAVLLLLALALRAGASQCPSTLRFVVGSYTNQPWLPDAIGKGLTVADLTPLGGRTVGVLPRARVGDNPTYCAAAPSGATYCCTGGDSSMSRLTGLASGTSARIAQAVQPGPGANHMAVLRKPAPGGGDRVLVADYSGKLQAWVARGDDPKAWLYREYVVPKSLTSNTSFRQEGPHPHQALELAADGDVLVCDLGADVVFRFKIGPKAEITLRQTIRLKAGDGPRHAATNPRVPGSVYVLNELSVSVVRLSAGGCDGRSAGGAFVACERRPFLQQEERPPFGGPIKITAAAIRVSADGRFLYASVRVLDGSTPGSIVVFALGKDGSIGRKVGTFSAQGVQPRDFAIIERFRDENGRCLSFVAIANRDSNHVVFVPRDAATGVLGKSVRFRLNVGTPTSVLAI